MKTYQCPLCGAICYSAATLESLIYPGCSCGGTELEEVEANE
jgi:hypothetical protein